MRGKLVLIILLIITQILSGCGQKNAIPDQIQDMTNDVSDHVLENEIYTINFTTHSMLYNNSEIYVIESNSSKTSHINFCDFFEEDKLVIGINHYPENAVSIYIFDLVSGEAHEIHRGEGYVDANFSSFRATENDGLIFQGANFIIFVDRQDLKVQSLQLLPKDGTEFILSNDGTKISYRTHKGLYISDLGFTDTKLIIEGDPNGCPGSPRWSSDDSKLSYTRYIYEGSEGYGIFNIENSKNIVFMKEDVMPGVIDFYMNNDKILGSLWDIGNTSIFSHDLKDNSFEVMSIDGEWNSAKPHPFQEQFAYVRVYNDQINTQIFIYDINQDSVRPITPIMDIRSIEWHRSGEKLMAFSEDRIIIVPTNN